MNKDVKTYWVIKIECLGRDGYVSAYINNDEIQDWDWEIQLNCAFAFFDEETAQEAIDSNPILCRPKYKARPIPVVRETKEVQQ